MRLENLRIIEETPAELPAYAEVPIAFPVESRLRVEVIDAGLGGLRFVEEAVAAYVKDYDLDEGEGPTRWAKRWDMSNWAIFAAFVGDVRVGGAVLAHDTPGSWFLEGRKDIAALWDIRVRPELRGSGIGSALFGRGVDWAKSRGCALLKIETQNVNVRACRFYAAKGCDLGGVGRFAYPGYPDEVQLIWYLRLA